MISLRDLASLSMLPLTGNIYIGKLSVYILTSLISFHFVFKKYLQVQMYIIKIIWYLFFSRQSIISLKYGWM